ncbi:hypothetical protein [Longispora albida]|uniref:hypothetical protein n=1 Tax=Longispora albida TaxID=203523 RepID=UPI0003640C98|nr:hypothetical protein [Longispora albida]
MSLAERQAALVAALVAGGPDPEGFDPGQLAVMRHALLVKRAGEVAAAWPALAREADLRALLAGHPPLGAHADGLRIARALASAGQLGPAGQAELARREAGRRPWYKKWIDVLNRR